jgi:hypothetical protein
MIVRIAKMQAGGWQRAMILVRLPGGGVLVHSPTWVGPETFAKVEAFGEPRVLFAPNHFHHLFLALFRDKWPSALAVAGRAALPRLKRLGHAPIAPVEDASPLLPPDARWLECEGTRAGETFLSISNDGRRTWIVCDAFFNIERVTGVVGAIMRALRGAPGLSVGRTFNWLALRDRPAYRAWILEALERDRPLSLWLSHGETATRDDLPEILAELVRRRV